MIARSHNCFLLLAILVAFLSSCDSRRVFEKNVEITNGVWDKSQQPQFNVKIEDTKSPHNIFINLRHTGVYPYSNLFLFIETEFPSGKTFRDTVECLLANEEGRWYGDGLGDIYDLQIPYRKNVRFSESGTYTFTFEQAMRQNPLPFVLDVGLRVEKAD